jgi:hypothetical protein
MIEITTGAGIQFGACWFEVDVLIARALKVALVDPHELGRPLIAHPTAAAIEKLAADDIDG